MFSKRRIINYNYLNSIQTNGSVIRLFDSISSMFLTNMTSFIKNSEHSDISFKNKHKQLLKFKSCIFFFLNDIKEHYYTNVFHLFFINKLYKCNSKWLSSKIKNSNLFNNNILLFNRKKKKKKPVRVRDIENEEETKEVEVEVIKIKINVYSKNYECAILNNIYIINILSKYYKKVIFNFFFNI